MSEPIKANCENCGAAVFLVNTIGGETIPITLPRHTVWMKTTEGWKEGIEAGYLMHVCKKK